jgi:hypothetical protein
MIYISHRGNISGKIEDLENTPEYIDRALELNYDVEIDLWVHGSRLFLGHDCGHSEINISFLYERKLKLWIHCKNYNAVNMMFGSKFNWFWHDQDDMTITSKGYIWVYPGKQPINNSIAVMPEIYKDDLSKCAGICSDVIKDYYEKSYILHTK